MRIAMAGAVAAIALLPATADAQGERCWEDALGPVPEWTVIVHGDMNEVNTDSEGRVAVGGNATLTNFGVASKLPDDGARVDLAVGGNLTGTNVGVNHGSVTYGGTLSGTVYAPRGTITQRPLDLDAAFQEAQRRSDAWGELAPNTTIGAPVFGVLTLQGPTPS